MSNIVGRAIGGVVNPVINQVDFNEVLQRIDWDEVIDRIDIDRVLDRVDIDRLLNRINVERLIERVPIEVLVERSNIKRIVAQSTSGILSQALDAIRVRAAIYDHYFHGAGRCACIGCNACKTKSNWTLPPKPGATQKGKKDIQTSVPRRLTEFAVAVQGRQAGLLSRTLAYLIDEGVMIVTSSIFSIVVNSLASQSGNYYEGLELPVWTFPAFYLVLSIFYNFASLASIGRTFGKAILGLLVVKATGKGISMFQAFVRACILAIPMASLFSSILGLFRKDRRCVHDLLCYTAVVYSWNANRYDLYPDETKPIDDKQQPIVEVLARFEPDDRI